MSSAPAALRPGPALRLATAGFLALWCLIAAFPLFWIAVMSFKLPVDAFDANALAVIFGPATRAAGKGLSVLGLGLGAVTLAALYWFAANRLAPLVEARTHPRWLPLGWLVGAALFGAAALVVLAVLLPLVLGGLAAVLGAVPGLRALTLPVIGLTGEHYRNIWVEQAFYRNFVNSLIVTGGVVTISLTVGTLAGYALARTRSNLAFWILIAALIFRALPHSVLVSGYLPPFINSAEILRPIMGDAAPTLYGQPLAVILVLVAINQPFTIWMLRSFFMSIPAELDEAARVDGCSHFEAFWRVIMPVMWPGVITTGLFSFLLAYNDFLVCSLLLDAQNQTMVPAIAGFFNRETTTTDQVRAVAAAVSIIAPLFLLIMVFQRQIVSGLTAGAVKG
jgi:multiple sugar transport system permease protein